jgi:hypothetical protein
VGTITRAFSALAKAFFAFQRSTSKELKVFLVVLAVILGWLGASFIWDVYGSWASTHLSASEHLKLAKDICEVKKNGKVFCVASPEVAIHHLEQIPTTASEYDEATRLLNAVKADAKRVAEQAEAVRKVQETVRGKAEAERVRLANQTEDESKLQMVRNLAAEAHDPFVCQKDANNAPIVSYDNGHYWWLDDGRCAEREEKEQQVKARAELEKHQAEQRLRDQDAELSSYWPTTIRVDTDMDSFWLNIPVQFWGGVDRNTVSNWKCRREKDDFICRAID